LKVSRTAVTCTDSDVVLQQGLQIRDNLTILPFFATIDTTVISHKIHVILSRGHVLPTSKRLSPKNQSTMAKKSSLSSWPPLSQTKANPKLPPTGAYTAHTPLINRRGSSLLQQFAVQTPQHNTSLPKIYRWCMHHSPPALCGV